MNFSEALSLLKNGVCFQRAGWNGKNMYVALCIPQNGLLSVPYIYIHTANSQFVPWTASQSDILADDWVEYEGPKGDAFPDERKDIKRYGDYKGYKRL